MKLQLRGFYGGAGGGSGPGTGVGRWRTGGSGQLAHGRGPSRGSLRALAGAAGAVWLGASLLGAAPAGAATRSTQPSLLVETGGTSGEPVYAWPHFPATVQLDNELSLVHLRWSSAAGPSAQAAGLLAVNLCTKSCATGPVRDYQVSINASRPRDCPVARYETLDGEGYLSYEEAYVYSAVAASLPAGSTAPKWARAQLSFPPRCPGTLPVSDWPPMSWRGAPREALRWVPAGSVGTASGAQLVSCASSRSCMVAAPAQGQSAYWDGSKWSGLRPLGRTGVTLTSLVCTAPGRCIAADQFGDVMTWDGASWSPPRRVDPHGGTSGLSCAGSGFCMAVDSGGYALTYLNGRWSGPKLVDRGANLRAVSCASPSFCGAADSSGHITVFDGRSWSKPLLVDPRGALFSISCPSSKSCLAVDTFGRVVSWDGSRWSAPEYVGVGLGGVATSSSPLACASANFCVLVDGAGNAFTYDGRRWSSPGRVGAGGAAVGSVACPAVAFCVAVGEDGTSVLGR